MQNKHPININKLQKYLIVIILIALLTDAIFFLIYKHYLKSVAAFFVAIAVQCLYLYFKNTLVQSYRIKKIESAFPDFLQLVSSNLRAGMTIDRALLISSRPEFNPLDEEILQTGKDITIGKSLTRALEDMAKRIGSEKIEKTIKLINSGITSGGDIAILLEETARNMRQREILQKKSASAVLMYVIFIFITISFLAPALFALSNVLVEVLSEIFSSVPELTNLPSTGSFSMPLVISKVNVSIGFIRYFSLVFIVALSISASLILGLINKGQEKEGLKYLPFMITFSIISFFVTKIFLSNFLKGFF